MTQKLVFGVVCTLALAGSPVFAQGGGTKGNGAPKGKFEKFLLVAPGNPNTTQTDLTNFLKNDTSSGRAIFIPVKTANGPKEAYCEAADGSGSFILGDSANENLGDVEPIDGVKLNFVKDSSLSSLQIADRDATDGYAEVRVPADWANAISVDLYMRVLGKPGGCIGADAFVYDGQYYFYAGTAVFKRKTGQSTFVNASELTDVWYCPDGSTVDPTGGHNYVCLAPDGTTEVDAVELNVFNLVFDEYFWDINNAGVRVTQVLMRANF
jgi:hypothetical protein